MSLCTIEDVQALLQGDIEPDDHPFVVALLEMATEAIEAELGRPAEGGTEIVEVRRFSRPGSLILLNRWPVTAVATVVEDGTTLTAGTDYDTDLAAGIVTRVSSGYPIYFPADVDTVITYTPATPPGLRLICAQAVARAIKAGRAYATRPAVLEGYKQLIVGRWSGTADDGATSLEATAALSLTEPELTSVRAYRDRLP